MIVHGTLDYIAPEGKHFADIAGRRNTHAYALAVLIFSEECVAGGQENSRSGKALPILGDPTPGYDASVDWWSYGAMLYEMTYGLPPFYADAVEDTYKRIVRCTVCSERYIAQVFPSETYCF